MTEDIPPIVLQAQRWMADTWREDDSLLDKFFPVHPIPDPNYEKARKKLFNEHPARGRKKSSDEKPRQKRWKGILSAPNPMSRIYRPLTNLLNRILECYGITRNNRVFLDTHRRRSSSNVVKPGIWLSGIGEEFASTSQTRPCARWDLTISVLEVALDSDDLIASRDRLAVHMHRIFEWQDNRRFVFGLIITQNEFTLFMFDHSGAVASKPCNYHTHPDRFCAVVSGLAGSGQRIGFDFNMFSVGGFTKIRMFHAEDGEPEKEQVYIVKKGLFRFPSLVGRGTLCWLTSREDDPNARFVVKDAWIAPSDPPGSESEASLLRHARSQGVVDGVVQLHHYEEVRRSKDALDLDTVLRNRQDDGSSPEYSKLERVHIRMVMSPFGKTIEHFASRKELLFAFHDVVVAHRKLYDVAGILHRDISARNVLIYPEGAEGNRGLLIDFDHSIRIDDKSQYSTKKHIGTRRFMSRNVLKGKAPHTYLDDLESFYYVLCWVLVAYERPGTLKEELPEMLSLWDGGLPMECKTALFGEDFKYPIDPWFGRSLPQLAIQLHDFFFVRLFKPASDPAKDYDEFLSLVRNAIVGLQTEEMEMEIAEASLRTETATVPGPLRSAPHKRRHDVSSCEAPDTIPLRCSPTDGTSSPAKTSREAPKHPRLP